MNINMICFFIEAIQSNKPINNLPIPNIKFLFPFHDSNKINFCVYSKALYHLILSTKLHVELIET
jgi:hypothetical protein